MIGVLTGDLQDRSWTRSLLPPASNFCSLGLPSVNSLVMIAQDSRNNQLRFYFKGCFCLQVPGLFGFAHPALAVL
jgi:hypothetical protein